MEQTVQRERKIRIIPATKPVSAPGRASGSKQRVAAYCRVSTDSEEQLTSYTAQKAYYTQKIGENPDWEMAGIFADKGITGTSMKKRTEFKRMIAACKRGRIDLILTKSLSRFARNTVDSLEMVRMLRANGIGVIFEKENINTLTESSEFLITLFSGFAQAESESISKNVIWGIQKSREAGNVPFQYKKLLGYRRGPDGQPEIIPEEAETVKRIFRRYLDGCSLGQIKAELEKDKVPTSCGVQSWTYQVIHNILVNEKYIGDALLQKTYTTDCISKTVKKNQGALTAQQAELLDKVLEDMENEELNAQLKATMEEKQAILGRLGALQQDEEQRAGQEARLRELAEWLKKQKSEFAEYDDSITRRYVERITVVDAETIRIKFRYTDVEIDRAVRT